MTKWARLDMQARHMHWWADDRGVTVQIGVVLLFGFLVVTFSLVQATVVPQWNAETEFEHNAQAQRALQDVGASVRQAGTAHMPQAVTVPLGVRYSERALYVNPPPATGTVATTSRTPVTIEHAQAIAPQHRSYWNGTAKQYTTRTIRYTPNYHEYHTAPESVVAPSITYNVFDDGATTLATTDQTLILDDQITLVTMAGDLRETGVGSATLNAVPQSAPMTAHTIEGTDAPITITIQTTLSEAEWRDALAPQRVANGGHITDISKSSDQLTITLEADETYTLRLGHVRVGTANATTTNQQLEPTYIVKTDGDNETLAKGGTHTVTATVYDGYGNPTSGVSVNATTADGTFANGNTSITRRTHANGAVTFTYTHDDTSNNDVNIDVSFAHDPETNFAKSRLTDARFTVALAAGGGGEGGGGSGDTTAPNATVESATYTTRGGGNLMYDVSVDWAATDDTELNGGSVNEVRLYDDTGTLVETTEINPTGTSDSGTVEFKDVGSDPSGWTVELVVSDGADNRDSDTETVTAA